jgi:hypothetical protein
MSGCVRRITQQGVQSGLIIESSQCFSIWSSHLQLSKGKRYTLMSFLPYQDVVTCISLCTTLVLHWLYTICLCLHTVCTVESCAYTALTSRPLLYPDIVRLRCPCKYSPHSCIPNHSKQRLPLNNVIIMSVNVFSLGFCLWAPVRHHIAS